MYCAEFEVPGKIKGKARPRFFNGHAVTPKDTISYENYIKILYQEKCNHRFVGAVKMKILAFYEMPKSKIKTAKAEEKFLRENPYPTKKPDSDNVAKIVADSLNKIAYNDDAQIVELIVLKRWGDDEGLRVIIGNV